MEKKNKIQAKENWLPNGGKQKKLKRFFCLTGKKIVMKIVIITLKRF